MIALELAAASVRLSAPLLCASLGELVGELAGVVNISIEGTMLVAAFAGTLVAYDSGSILLGLAAALAAGIAFTGIFAWLVIFARADQILAGTAMNLVAFGLTGTLYRGRFGATGTALTVPTFQPIRIPGLADLPVVGPLLFEHNALVYAAFLAVPLIAFAVTATWPGLALRAAGEKPEALEAAGTSVKWTRFAALLIEGALAGLGGAYLSLAHSATFIEGITAGRGFMAIAIVVSGRWSAPGVLGVSLLFGTATAAQFHFQAAAMDVPYQLIRAIPYMLTLAVLASMSRSRSAAPAALGKSGPPA